MAASIKDQPDPQHGRLPYSKPFAHSCSFCQVQEIDSGMKASWSDGSYMVITVHYRGTRVFEGASNKCAFFAHCLRLLVPTMRSIRSEQVSTPNLSQLKNWVYEIDFRTRREPKSIENGTGKWRYVGGVLPQAVIRPEDQHYVPIAATNNPSAKDIPQRPFLHNYKTRGSTEWAVQCMSECDKSHSACKRPKPVYVPSKLLHIEHSESEESLLVRLCYTASSDHTADEQFTYATVSYCWGGHQDFRLDATSEEKLLRGVAVSMLPKTLIDSIKTAFGLGISWIWIDSLCIRQDDDVEKAIEVAQMHQVYGSSNVTISATRADSCKQGFLHPCSLPPLGRLSYRLPFALSAGELGSVILSNVDNATPIDRRSWTLQEHLLARRVLRFTDYGQHWSCETILKFENIDTLYPPKDYRKGVEDICRMAKKLRGDIADFWVCGVDDWMDIVVQYTSRQLTVASDKLLAISAIAEAWDSESKDTYLAGIWQSHLPEGLMWACKDPRLQVPSATYVAPSWSWASICGGVWLMGISSGDVDPQLDILTHSVKLVDEHAPYGAVKEGALIMTGLLQRTKIEAAPSQAFTGDETSPELDLSLAHTVLDFCGETLRAKIAETHLFCLQITVYNDEEMAGPCGLILASTDFSEFTRIGTFEFFSTSIEEEMEEDFEDEEEMIKQHAVQIDAFQEVEPREFRLI